MPFSTTRIPAVASLALAAAFASLPATAQADDDFELEAAPAPTPAAPPPPAEPPLEAPATLAPPAPAAPGATPLVAPPDAAVPGPAELGPTEPAPAEPPSPWWIATPHAAAWSGVDWTVGGYLQAQWGEFETSSNGVDADGQPRNEDGFVVRRGCVSLSGTHRGIGAAFEIDVNTLRGSSISMRRAEAIASTAGLDAEPYGRWELRAGIVGVPFGYELAAGHRDRLHLERTLGSSALFTGETDVGARLTANLGSVRIDGAILNGDPISDRAGVFTRNVVSDVDYLVRVSLVDADGALRFDAGTSFVTGHGAVLGTPPTKDTFVWSDNDEDSIIDSGELVPIPGRAGTPTETFERWALNLHAALAFESPLGWTHASTELTLSNNLDRGFIASDPLAAGVDARGLGWHATLLQDLPLGLFVGARLESYDPETDAFESRRGNVVPASLRVTTLSPLLGLHVANRTRLVFQYDRVSDRLDRDDRGVPVDLANDRWALRWQVNL